jgi:hydroxymethylpyrimidine/phosphomethylpyrimidine kinase
MGEHVPVVLVVGGHDPTLGAGVAADALAVTLAGARVRAAVAVMTVQGPGRSVVCRAVDPDLLDGQLEALGDGVRVVKTGALGGRKQVMSVVRFVDGHEGLALVVDPVMGASAGGELLDAQGREAMGTELIARATLVTPNLDEAALLAGMSCCTDRDGMRHAADRIVEMGAMWVLVKGGHLAGPPADLLAGPAGEQVWIEGTRVDVDRTHGTGCALASAIAGYMARSMTVQDACRAARELLVRALEGATGEEAAPDLLGYFRRMSEVGR